MVERSFFLAKGHPALCRSNAVVWTTLASNATVWLGSLEVQSYSLGKLDSLGTTFVTGDRITLLAGWLPQPIGSSCISLAVFLPVLSGKTFLTEPRAWLRTYWTGYQISNVFKSWTAYTISCAGNHTTVKAWWLRSPKCPTLFRIKYCCFKIK